MACPSYQTNAAWIVQHFSGESILSSLLTIVQDIIPQHLTGYRLAIVCSPAVVFEKCATSELLLRAASQVHRQRRDHTQACPSAAQPALEILAADYFHLEYSNLVCKSIRDPLVREELQVEIDEECAWLRQFLGTCKGWYGTHGHLAEEVMTTMSERLTSRIVLATLLDQGLPAQLVSSEQIDLLLDATVTGDFCSNSLTDSLIDAVGKSYPRIPIVTGILYSFDTFPSESGNSPERLAALLSNGLRADELQLWIDSPPLLTGDPHKIPSARVVPSVSRSQMSILAKHRHPFLQTPILAEIVSQDINITLNDVRRPNTASTTIRAETRFIPHMNTSSASMRPLHLKKKVLDAQERRPTTIFGGDEAVMISITPRPGIPFSVFLQRVFSTLERHRAPLKLFNVSDSFFSVVFELEELAGSVEILAEELGSYGTVFFKSELSVLTIVGDSMKSSGTSGHVVSVLTQGGIAVHMVGPMGDMTLSCVVEVRESTRALRLLHQTLLRKVDRPRNRILQTLNR